ncbi:fatty acyl-CoA reductase wat-like isoform X2 [Macrosteles quadrilineatus]|nr:fatty acyl-CoA reductase wat-like isoform X2 [Macrosteles quadrilineatus]
MLKLEAFVYVSTAYCNCDSPLVQEKVSGCRISPENLMNLPNLLDENTLDEVTPVLLGSKPNSYIFTKCAAEVIIDKFKTSLPVAIFRPSIVLSSESEPFPGWIDNVSGPTGMAASLSAGLLHTTHFKYGAKVNLVPVDYTVNGIIALGYSVGSCKWVSPGEMPVVNFVSTADNTITWGKFGDLLNHYMWQYPSAKLHWYPFTVRAGHHWSYVGLRTLFHYFPAALVDWATARLGQPTKLTQFYRRLDKYAAVVVYFSTREFKFEEGNADRLWNSLDSTDQEMFPFNMAAMDWNVYLRSYVLGCRRFLLKEGHNTIVASRRRIKMLYFLHLLTASAFFFLFYKFTVHFGRLFGKKPSLGPK